MSEEKIDTIQTININRLKTGDILKHVLGFKVSVVKIITRDWEGRPIYPVHIECRYIDDLGLHNIEFSINELRNENIYRG